MQDGSKKRSSIEDPGSLGQQHAYGDPKRKKVEVDLNLDGTRNNNIYNFLVFC